MTAEELKQLREEFPVASSTDAEVEATYANRTRFLRTLERCSNVHHTTLGRDLYVRRPDGGVEPVYTPQYFVCAENRSITQAAGRLAELVSDGVPPYLESLSKVYQCQSPSSASLEYAVSHLTYMLKMLDCPGPYNVMHGPQYGYVPSHVARRLKSEYNLVHLEDGGSQGLVVFADAKDSLQVISACRATPFYRERGGYLYLVASERVYSNTDGLGIAFYAGAGE